MKIEKFWNRAFLAALTRVPAHAALQEADSALAIAIAHWQTKNMTWATYPTLWQRQHVEHVPQPSDQPLLSSSHAA